MAWIEAKKQEGNDEYKNKNFSEATNKYLFALCGFDFKKIASSDQKIWTDKNLKIPLLNNMGQCLI